MSYKVSWLGVVFTIKTCQTYRMLDLLSLASWKILPFWTWGSSVCIAAHQMMMLLGDAQCFRWSAWQPGRVLGREIIQVTLEYNLWIELISVRQQWGCVYLHNVPRKVNAAFLGTKRKALLWKASSDEVWWWGLIFSTSLKILLLVKAFSTLLKASVPMKTSARPHINELNTESLYIWVHAQPDRSLENCDSVYSLYEESPLNLHTSASNWANAPAFSHLCLSLDARGACKHWGKAGSSWTWTSRMWFRIDVHFASLSGPDVDEAAVQYMWFFILWIHFFSMAQSLFFDIKTNFLDSPNNTKSVFQLCKYTVHMKYKSLILYKKI